MTVKTTVGIFQTNETAHARPAATPSFGATMDDVFLNCTAVTVTTTVEIIQTNKTARDHPAATTSFGATMDDVFLNCTAVTVTTTVEIIQTNKTARDHPAATTSFGATMDDVFLNCTAVTVTTTVEIIQTNKTARDHPATTSFGATMDTVVLNRTAATVTTTVEIFQTNKTAHPVATTSFGATMDAVFLNHTAATVTTTVETIRMKMIIALALFTNFSAGTDNAFIHPIAAMVILTATTMKTTALGRLFTLSFILDVAQDMLGRCEEYSGGEPCARSRTGSRVLVDSRYNQSYLGAHSFKAIEKYNIAKREPCGNVVINLYCYMLYPDCLTNGSNNHYPAPLCFDNCFTTVYGKDGRCFHDYKKTIASLEDYFVNEQINLIQKPFRVPKCADLPRSADSQCMLYKNLPETEASFNMNMVAIAVATTLFAVMVLAIPTVIWCKKRRRTLNRQEANTQIVVQMHTCSKKLWDSEIVAEIGDLGVCPSRLVVEKEIGVGW